MGHPIVSTLHDVLEVAYHPEQVGRHFADRFLLAGQKLGAMIPIRANLTKDRRLVVSYQAEIESGCAGARTTVPVFLHSGLLADEDRYLHFRDSPTAAGHGLTPELRRHADRWGSDLFLTAFPCDPEISGLSRILRPGRLLEAFNSDLHPERQCEAVTVSAELLGYRPERRVVLKLRVVDSHNLTRFFLLKLYRKGQSSKISQYGLNFSQSLRAKVCVPIGYALADGAIIYPYIEGITLNQNLLQGLNCENFVKETALALHQLQGGIASIEGDGIQRFDREQEINVIEQWRRFLKKGKHSAHGVIASHLETVTSIPERDEEHSEGLLHRDFYPKQVIVSSLTGQVHIVDIDTMAFGPRALDAGNFLAHLYAIRAGSEHSERLRRAAKSFLKSMLKQKVPSEQIRWYSCTSLIRLACLDIAGPGRGRDLDFLSGRLRQLIRK